MMSQEALNKLAYEYACSRAKSDPLCDGTTTHGLGDLDRCMCLGADYLATITVTGGTPALWVLESGTLPPGLSFDSATGIISGTATAEGTYNFTIAAYMANNSSGRKTYTLSVLEILTTALPDYVMGSPYSYQLLASGGSGNYSWIVKTGTLPEGLTLSADGLLSGTPTAAGTSPLLFEVVDLTCEAASEATYPPGISLRTVSHTILRTKRGFPDFASGTTLYKIATYSGTATQIAYPQYNYNADDTTQCAGARYDYSGWDEIDVNGGIVSRHSKFLTVMCNAETPAVYIPVYDYSSDTYILVGAAYLPVLLGYCWTADTGSCATCDDDPAAWINTGDRAVFGKSDYPTLMAGTATTITADTMSSNASANYPSLVLNRPGFPKNDGNGFFDAQFGFFQAINTANWSIVLSSEFTNADAISGQQVSTGGGKTAENKPLLKSWWSGGIYNIQSRYVTVNFDLQCRNLVIGSEYIASYELWDSDGTHVVVASTFTAAATTHSILGSVGLPAAGHTTTMKNPKLNYT